MYIDPTLLYMVNTNDVPNCIVQWNADDLIPTQWLRYNKCHFCEMTFIAILTEK